MEQFSKLISQSQDLLERKNLLFLFHVLNNKNKIDYAQLKDLILCLSQAISESSNKVSEHIYILFLICGMFYTINIVRFFN